MAMTQRAAKVGLSFGRPPGTRTMTAPSSHRTRRLVGLLAVVALLAVGCSGGGEQDVAAPSPTPTATSSLPPPPSWPPPTEEPTTPEAKVVAASERYLEVLSEAADCVDEDDLGADERRELEPIHGCIDTLPWDSVSLRGDVTGGRVEAANLLLADRTARTNYWLGTVTQTEIAGDRATVRSCGVTEARTWRQFTMTLEHGEEGWLVGAWTKGESCQPDEEQLEEQIRDAYLRYHRAAKAAFASGNPDHPGLATAATEVQREHLSNEIAEEAAKGRIYRDFSDRHPEVVQIRSSEDGFPWSVAIVQDCAVSDPMSGTYDRETGEPIALVGAEASRTLSLSQVELVEEEQGLVWKLAALDPKEEDSSCEPQVAAP